MRNYISIKGFLIIFTSFILLGCGGGNVSVIPSTDSFTQEGQEITAKMDILWVIDNSGSMNDFQQAVEDNLLSFMNNFSQKGYDFQIAVTVSDGWKDMDYTNYVADGGPTFSASNRSRFKSSVDGTTVLSSSEDSAVLLQKFQEIVASVGTSGSGDERVMQSTQAALLNPLNIADGFFRDDAHLAVIFVSDEEDTSWRQSNYITNAPGCSGPYTGGDMNAGCASQVESVTYFRDFLVANSSDVYGATVHNMAIEDGDEVCRTSDAMYNRYFGVRTSELATLTGGTISSLCGVFADSLNNIAQTIIERSVEFLLDKVPSDPNAISVTVQESGDPEPVAVAQDSDNGWSYNASANSIVFHGDAIPNQGALISITFDSGSL